MFLDSRIDLDEFEDWFLQNTWNIHLNGSAAVEELSFSVEESLSEYSSRHIAPSELRRELSELVHRDNKELVYRDASVFDKKPKVSWSASALVVPVFARL